VQTTPRRTGIHSFDSTGDNNEKRLTPKPFLALNAGLGDSKTACEYNKGDYAAALQHLARVPQDAPQTLAARFYAGTCQFAVYDLDSARGSWEKVADYGDSPQ